MINILVVEDDLKLNQIVCAFLNNNGYTAKGCLNPREAYDLMYNSLYDLIISDIMMPDIDGFEFAELLSLEKVENAAKYCGITGLVFGGMSVLIGIYMIIRVKLNIPRETVRASAQLGPVFRRKRSGNPRVAPLNKTR